MNMKMIGRACLAELVLTLQTKAGLIAVPDVRSRGMIEAAYYSHTIRTLIDGGCQLGVTCHRRSGLSG